MSKKLIIYHNGCADGFGAAWCFWRKYGVNADYHAAAYHDVPPDVVGRDVYLVDFSYPRAVVSCLLQDAKSVTLIDHHKTALDDLHGLDGLINYTDINRSGAMLAWNYLFTDEEPPQLITHIQDRDLWQFKLQNTREIMAAVFSYEFDFLVWDRLMNLTDCGLYELVQQGTALERKHKKDVANLINTNSRFMNIGEHTVLVANLPGLFASDAGNLMCKDKVFAASYFDTADKRIFSLRSDENGIDVSLIAKEYGGGGHYHAAGFSVPRDHVLAMS